MSDPFAPIARALDDACDRDLGERLRILPQGGLGYTSTASDPGRQPGEVVGSVLVAVSGEPLPGASRSPGTAGLGRLSLSDHAVLLSGSAVAALGYRPRKGDHLVRLDQQPDALFEIAAVDLVAFGDLALSIVAVGNHP